MNSTDTKPKSKAEREAEEKARRRAEAATIVAGLKQALDGDEQLLGFARGRLAGGIRGKLSLGPEAFFAPFVNIGLTERRLVIQHINAETGRPGEILPHYYALGDIAAMSFSDIETFGGEAAARLTMRLRNDQHTRLRLRGQGNLENAQAIVEVFRSLTSAQRPRTTPTQRVCATCQHILDQPFKFCPYCGQQQDLNATPSSAPTAAAEPERTYPPTPPGPTEPDFLDTVPYQDAGAFRGPTVEDGLEFLTPEPAMEPTVVPEAETRPVPESEPDSPAAVKVETEAASTEESAFETPSSFEGWSVDPGAGAAVVEPSAPDDPLPNPTSESSFVAGVTVETEAFVVEPTEEAVFTYAESDADANSRSHGHSVVDTDLAKIDPEAEFAPIPQSPSLASASEEREPTAILDTSALELEPLPTPESVATSVPTEFSTSTDTDESGPGWSPAPVSEATGSASTAFETFSPPASPAEPAFALPEFGVPDTSAEAEAAPPHESAGFVTEPAPAETQTPVSQEFEAFAPVEPIPPVPAVADAPESSGPAVAPSAFTGPTPTPDPIVSIAPLTMPPVPPVTASPSEDRFAALLREVRGGDAPSQSAVEPPSVPERRDGPMSVQVHINRAPIVVNETFVGRNADEIVGKLKARILPELNFALRLMVNSFSNLRFAQEIVRRYNEKEKASYPVPNSCWEFLLSAEEINYVSIHLNS